jgi:hypothetical protein
MLKSKVYPGDSEIEFGNLNVLEWIMDREAHCVVFFNVKLCQIKISVISLL